MACRCVAKVFDRLRPFGNLIRAFQPPVAGSILAYGLLGNTVEIKHVWKNLEEAQEWAENRRYVLGKCGHQYFIVCNDGSLAKWEADFIAKMQDTDGAFYYMVYPRDREYEFDVLPENGDPAVVWFLSGILKAVGAEVFEAHDGERAISNIEENERASIEDPDDDGVEADKDQKAEGHFSLSCDLRVDLDLRFRKSAASDCSDERKNE